MAVLVDTSGLYALVDASEREHRLVSSFVRASTEPLMVPVTVLPEIDYLCARRLGVAVEVAVLGAIARGEFALEPFSEADLERSLELVERYADSDIGLVDASIVATAERLRISRILTFDHRHFSVFHPRHCDAFELVP